MRASNSTHGDVEWSCAHVIWRYLGVDVALADDGTEDAMVDVEIDDTNGSRAVCEIVTDTDPHRAAAYERFRDCNFRVPTDQLRMAWQAELSTRCDFRKLNRLPLTLSELESRNLQTSELTPLDELHIVPSTTRQTLRRLGVLKLFCRRRFPSDGDYIAIFPQSLEYGFEDTWDTFHGQLTLLLASARLADVRRKLSATGAKERHLFLGFSMSSEECFHGWMHHERTELPDRPPLLPDEVTHLWLWCADLPARRVLGWFPDRGWFDPSLNWAVSF